MPVICIYSAWTAHTREVVPQSSILIHVARPADILPEFELQMTQRQATKGRFERLGGWLLTGYLPVNGKPTF